MKISVRELKSRLSEYLRKRIDALRDEEIDLSDDPEVTPEMFAKAIVRRSLIAVPPRK